ncbi:cation transporter [Shewanella psychropiezotolerans]|uniref:Cation transporter n=1 Tax=Shewanella psychropiezotolerans TaxID=2593655 RepID=A0ABX5WT95_9GAMM|nr:MULTISPECIES: cation transporter [Shewanella]MPY25035.1 cation transporter [Shewanella sp. YLB-07]QDO82286.1 cation transporter [Shewanella psychropiezotolerans]
MKDKIGIIERQSISIGLVANFVMALSGWFTFYLSGSEALLLDGNMSFILFLSSIVAFKISKIKTIRSETFPFGLYVTEALYSLMKGLLLLGVIISAITSNANKVFQYLEGEPLNMIKTGPIAYYAIAMVSICWGLSAMYRVQNRRIKMGSSMLKVDQKASFIDGILSASTGAILVVIGYVQPGSQFDFLLYIGDALLVILLAIAILGQPVGIIKEAFVELAGGKLQDEAQHQLIEDKVNRQLELQGISSESLNIGKTGSSYLVIISLSLSKLSGSNSNAVMMMKESLKAELTDEFTFVDVELVLV